MARTMTTSRHRLRALIRSLPEELPRGPIPQCSSPPQATALPLFVVTSPKDPFPFMSLPPEIRLMIYEAALPEAFYFSRVGSFPTGITPTIRALMAVNRIRDELIPHIFQSRPFHWVQNLVTWNDLCTDNLDYFKRTVITSTRNLTFWFPAPHSAPETVPQYQRLTQEFLLWARWRSQRPHLYPWNLKRLTLAERRDLIPVHRQVRNPVYPALHITRGPDEFLVNFSLILGLESLRVVFNCRAGEEAMREFLERCASCGIEGRIGFSQAGDGRASEWFMLQDDQVVRTSA